MTFSELDLSPEIIRAIDLLNFQTPTEIQQKAIPLLKESNNDFVGQAQTGTGKTAAFVIPLLERILQNPKSNQALILTPTRELAYQVEKELNNFGRYLDISSVLIYGGTPYDKQIGVLKRKRPEIVVGTPGRVIDLIERGALKLKDSEYLVLDEADEMLKMGFIEDVQRILEEFREDRKMWMFSATMPREITELIKRNSDNPDFISCKKKTLSNEDIEQSHFLIDRKYRFEALYRLILTNGQQQSLVFCRTRQETKDVADKLIGRDIKADLLNGDLSQSQRESAMAKFKAGKTHILVCTDVAARGIDVSGLSFVYNYGLPQDDESYVHRIGRTGRAGAKGVAQSILTSSEMGSLRRIEKAINQRIPRAQLPKPTDIKKSLVEQRLEKISRIKGSVESKGEEFKIDASFSTFESFLAENSKDEIEKILFTLLFNQEFHNIDKIDLKAAPQRDGRSRNPRRGNGGRRFSDRDRNGGRGGRDGRSRNRQRSRGGQRSHR